MKPSTSPPSAAARSPAPARTHANAPAPASAATRAGARGAGDPVATIGRIAPVGSSAPLDVATSAAVAASRAIDLLQLQYFVQLARGLSIVETARQFRVTQPSLTRQVVALESALGVELFHRSPKGLSLTEAGNTALYEFTSFLESYEQAVAEIATPPAPTLVPLRVGVPWWASIGHAAALERRAVASGQFSGIEFEVVASAAGADAVREGRLDVAIVAQPIDEHGLDATPFHHIDCCALVPAAHPLARLREIPLAALAVLPRFVMFSRQRNPLQFRWLRERHAAAGFMPERIVYVEDPASMIHLVASGNAAAAFNTLAPRHLRFDGVAARPLAPVDTLRSDVCLVTSQAAPVALPEGALDALRELLMEHPVTQTRPPPVARAMR